jgi:hypothetical protein
MPGKIHRRIEFDEEIITRYNKHREKLPAFWWIMNHLLSAYLDLIEAKDKDKSNPFLKAAKEVLDEGG